MTTLRRYIDKYRVGSTLTLLFLAIIWLLPTIGLFITSLREKTEAQTSGWWTHRAKARSRWYKPWLSCTKCLRCARVGPRHSALCM